MRLHWSVSGAQFQTNRRGSPQASRPLRRVCRQLPALGWSSCDFAASKPVLTLPPRMHMFVGRTLTVSGVPSGAAPKSRPRLYERNTPQNSPRSAAADQEGDNWSFHSSASATLPPPAAVGVNDVAESNNIHSGPAVVRNGPAMRGILKNSRANGSAARTWGPASARVVTSSAHERRKEYSNGAVLSLTPRRLWKYYFAGKKNPVMNPV